MTNPLLVALDEQAVLKALVATIDEFGYIDIHISAVDQRGDVMAWARGLRVDHVAREMFRHLTAPVDIAKSDDTT